MRFASETTVPVEKSKAEIEETLRRYGASEYQTGWKVDSAMVAFRLKQLFVRFVVPYPDVKGKKFTHKKVRGYEKPLSELQRSRVYDQEIRQRWRALLLVVKAKLEAVDCGISTLEQEFLAFIILPDDRTLLDWLSDDVLPAIRNGNMPRGLLTGPTTPSPNPTIEEAEFSVKQ